MRCPRSGAGGGFRKTMVARPVSLDKFQQVATGVGRTEDAQGAAPQASPAWSRREKLRAELLAAVEQVLQSSEAETLLEQLAGSSGGLDEREQWLLGLRQRVGAAMAQVTLQRERGYTGARRNCTCGRTARYVRDDEKRYVTLVGEVELQRAEYWCPQCGAFRPLDEQWDLPEGRFTRGVVRLAASLGAACPSSGRRRRWGRSGGCT